MSSRGLSPAQIAEKHARRTAAAIPDMIAGVEAVKVAPGVKAAAAVQKMRQNILDAIDSGRWGENTAAVPLATWQESMKTKGAQRLQQGLIAGQEKVAAFFAELLPFQQSALAELDKMQNLTLEDGIARSAFWIRRMAEFPARRKRK